MIFRKYLSSLRSTYVFMLCFGLFMGIIFPFYSAIFFGSNAFNPLYIVGCLTAGIAVGTFCYYIIKQVLKLYLERQWQTIRQLSSTECEHLAQTPGDELQALMSCYNGVMDKVLIMVGTISALIDQITPLHLQLDDKSRIMVQGSEKQATKENETLCAVEEMNDFFNILLKEIKELSDRTDERASLSMEMSATTDAIAENIKDYSSSVLETSASIEEMALNIKEIASNIEALSASTEQTSSSTMQISTAIDNVRDNTQSTAECSENLRRQAQEGIRAMGATLKAMREIEKGNEESFEAINRLSVHSARVGEFLNVIQEVVEQTNLLSLNAAIIAAQAGERGKAFTVVAEEVRSLANRTASSAKGIEDLVKNIQKETAAVQRSVTQGKDRIKEGVKVSLLTNDALGRIEQSSAEASQMVQKIASATMEQASGSKLITEEADKNLHRVKQVTRAIREQEKAITLIVKTLENMRILSQKISTSTQEHANGNHLYMQSVLEDNEKVKKLRDTCLQQIMMAEVLLKYVKESGALMQANAVDARNNMEDIGIITNLTNRLQMELEPFKHQSAAL